MKESCANWDFRAHEEKEASRLYLERGYAVHRIDTNIFTSIKLIVVNAVRDYLGVDDQIELENIHTIVDKGDSNRLRLHVLKELWKSDQINRLYYQGCRDIVELLCGNELAMQKKIGLSMQFPKNAADALPIHSDVWNGVSAYDLNILIPLVNCSRTKSLYILERESYCEALKEMPGLLSETSEEIFYRLKSKLTWVSIEQGSVLAFDQTLPHGFAVNDEEDTHWSLNCRFKSLFSPYADKLLGEYFVPITTKACTMVGIGYSEPYQWL